VKARITRDVTLNVLTGAIALAAVGSLANDRLRPMLAERGRLDPGEAVETPILLRRIMRSDTVGVIGADPTLVVVFQSTCDVCERLSPTWQGLATAVGTRPIAVALEADSTAVSWLAANLPSAVGVSPLDLSAFLDRFRIRAVPTTILLAAGRLQMIRLGPLQSDDIARIHRAFGTAEARPRLNTIYP